MNSLIKRFILVLLGFSIQAYALTPEMQADKLMSQIVALIKEEKSAEALQRFRELEKIEPSLKTPLPDSYYYYYIETLDKTGAKTDALSRANAYLEKFGKRGSNYSKIIEISSRLEIQIAREEKEAAEKKAREEKAARSSRLEMVAIPGRNFEIGKYEVTQGQWKAIMGNNPSEFSNCGDDCPVEQVSWFDAKAFIQKLNARTGKQFRLPDEQEWEYACYGGTQSEYCGGNNLDSVGWYAGNSDQTTHPVGQKKANGYGLYDMTGNVLEWLQGCFNCGLRGGDWSEGQPLERAAFRGRLAPDYVYGHAGLRLARTLP